MTADEVRRAVTAIQAWRTGAADAITCPKCHAVGLEIADRSARPYTEWYQLNCRACGLDQALAIPMAPPSGS